MRVLPMELPDCSPHPTEREYLKLRNSLRVIVISLLIVSRYEGRFVFQLSVACLAELSKKDPRH